MTQLALAVDADDELWTLDDLPTPEAPYVEVEDELIEVRSRFPSSYYTLTGETLPPKIRVRRGIAGTTAASHIQGSTLTPNYGLGGGGGGAITVVSDVDPGGIGAGNIWLREYDDTAVTGDMLYDIHIRNDADDGWLRPQLLQIADGVLRSRITLDGPATGGDIEVRDANGDQVLLASWGGAGEVDIQNNAADFSWVNKLWMKAGEYLIERADGGNTSAVYLGPTSVGLQVHAGANIKLSGLPTSDPGAGENVWNDAGTLKITAAA